MMCQLASAHDVFRDLQNNLKEGSKFYNDLTQVSLLLMPKIQMKLIYTVSVKSRISSIKNCGFVFWKNGRTRHDFLMIN